ncbi:hypothetical protein C9374_010547 [Naegleria lovaniensis]|uniref:Uncharacterized protein n=1 Tax=Naegleria lovaniensis TaxID=51637 RepID=A0AA88GH70_NAELO|nr:uncharacterized protein C9374_010547 [Naegleria lovaniensis]KAG2374803.1 hypothetical protein C9374_010547 [Naegleria lovaniensis]
MPSSPILRMGVVSSSPGSSSARSSEAQNKAVHVIVEEEDHHQQERHDKDHQHEYIVISSQTEEYEDDEVVESEVVVMDHQVSEPHKHHVISSPILISEENFNCNSNFDFENNMYHILYFCNTHHSSKKVGSDSTVSTINSPHATFKKLNFRNLLNDYMIRKMYCSSYVLIENSKGDIYECTPMTTSDIGSELQKLKKINFPFIPRVTSEGKGVSRYYISASNEIWSAHGSSKFNKEPIEKIPKILRIFVGYGHSALLSEKGIFLKSANASQFAFFDIGPLGEMERIEDIQFGLQHFVIYKSNLGNTNLGKLILCGNNDLGQLAAESRILKAEKPIVIDWSKGRVKKIDCLNCTCVLTESGDLYVTGENAHGELSVGDTTNRFGFVKANSPSPLIDFACGKHIMVALSTLHELFVCGDNKWMKLVLHGTECPDKITEFIKINIPRGFIMNNISCKDDCVMLYNASQHYEATVLQHGQAILRKFPHDHVSSLGCPIFLPLLEKMAPKLCRLSIGSSFLPLSSMAADEKRMLILVVHSLLYNCQHDLYYCENTNDLVTALYILSLINGELQDMANILLDSIQRRISSWNILHLLDTVCAYLEKLKQFMKSSQANNFIQLKYLEALREYFLDCIKCNEDNENFDKNKLQKYLPNLWQRKPKNKIHAIIGDAKTTTLKDALVSLFYDPIHADLEVFLTLSSTVKLHKTVLFSGMTKLQNILENLDPSIMSENGTDCSITNLFFFLIFEPIKEGISQGDHEMAENEFGDLCQLLLKFCYGIFERQSITERMVIPLLPWPIIWEWNY